MTLDCEASGGPDGVDPSYEWAGSSVGLLSDANIRNPVFVVPGNVDADTDYDYTVTMSAAGVPDVTADVTVTVKEKPDIACGSLAILSNSWFEGVGQVPLSVCDDEWTGAPAGADYMFSWEGSTEATDLLSSTTAENPLFSVPDDVDEDTTYNYQVAVSARNADPAALAYTVIVRNYVPPPPSIACTDPDPVYEGSDALTVSCTEENKPPGQPTVGRVRTLTIG